MTVPRCTACLPGRRRIALTTGALACLDNGQVDAVLAHERAHLSELHHLILALAVALEHAFPAIRFFAVAARQITYLTEVAADDAAARRALRLTLAAALLAAVAVGVLAAALAAGGKCRSAAHQPPHRPPLRGSMARRVGTSAALATTAALAITALGVAVVTISGVRRRRMPGRTPCFPA